jgi:sugar phosphate isomerase/epimerase
MKLGCTQNLLKPQEGAPPVVGQIERAAHFGLQAMMLIIPYLSPDIRTPAFYRAIAEASQQHGVELRPITAGRFGSADPEARKQDVDRVIMELRDAREHAGLEYAALANWPMTHTRWAPEPPLDERIDIIGENLAAVASAVPDMTLGLENHTDYRGHEIAAMLARANRPNMLAQLDTGNPFCVFEDPVDAARALARYTVSVHLKDVKVTTFADVADPAPGIRGEAVPLGEGMVDNEAILRILAAEAPDPASIRLTMEPLYMPRGIDPERDFLLPSIAWAREKLAAYLD